MGVSGSSGTRRCTAMHPADLSDDELQGQCEVTRTRRSGPGGQHRNKVETAVVLEHRPTGVKAEANEERSQERNRCVALKRLRVKLALEVRTARESPSERWLSRVRGGRLVLSAEHEDFPRLLAEALDFLAANDFEPSPAAEALRVTPSQLIKLLRSEPKSLALVNAARVAANRHPLK